MPLYLYTPDEQNGCFSNFSRHGVEPNEWYWPTVEHYRITTGGAWRMDRAGTGSDAS
jgi:predicted NAD-dependent protein-ADP-ribosyltransferase YbiA (DUF1768 family)